MADQKITDLAALTGSGAASGDLAVVVDVSDTSMAASGTDKKITLSELATAITTLGSLATDAEVASAISALSSTYQPLDSDLTAIAALSTTSFGRGFLVLADAAAGRTTLGLGTAATADTGTGASNVPTITQADARYQPLDGDLTAIADLTSAADRLPYFTGSGTASLATFTSAGRALVDDADAAAQRTTLGLGTAATANTGTGASDVPTITTADARYQPLDSDLTAIAALTTTTFGRSLLALADSSAARTTLGLVIGTDVQAYDAELAAIAGLTSAADRLPYFTGSGTAALATFTSAGRALVDDADAAAQRTTLGLGTMATATATDYQTKASFPVTIGVALSDETTALTTGQKVEMQAPYAFTLSEVVMTLTTASSSGLPTLDVKEGGVSIFSTKVTVDANEKTSRTAATAAVISDSSIANNGVLTFHIDVAGTGAAGAKVWLLGTRTVS